MLRRSTDIRPHNLGEGQNQHFVAVGESRYVENDMVRDGKAVSQQSKLSVPQNYKIISRKQRKGQSRAIVSVDEGFVVNAGSIRLQRLVVGRELATRG